MSSTKLIRAAVVLAVLCASVLFQPMTASAAARDYWILGQPSNKCIDVPNSVGTNGTVVNIYGCKVADNQNWKFEDKVGGYQIRNPALNKCLVVQNNWPTDNVAIILYDCNQSLNSLWKSVEINVNNGNAHDWYQIENASTHKCLTVKNAWTSNNTPLLQYTCSSKAESINHTNALWTWY